MVVRFKPRPQQRQESQTTPPPPPRAVLTTLMDDLQVLALARPLWVHTFAAVVHAMAEHVRSMAPPGA